MSVELLVEFLSARWDDASASPMNKGDPFEVIELLWPMLALFQPEGAWHGAIDLPYDPAHEGEVDAALDAMAADPQAGCSIQTPQGARVLHERVIQSITILRANAAAGQTVLCPSRALKPEWQRAAAAILWLHQMVLPFEPGTVLPPMRERH